MTIRLTVKKGKTPAPEKKNNTDSSAGPSNPHRTSRTKMVYHKAHGGEPLPGNQSYHWLMHAGYSVDGDKCKPVVGSCVVCGKNNAHIWCR